MNINGVNGLDFSNVVSQTITGINPNISGTIIIPYEGSSGYSFYPLTVPQEQFQPQIEKQKEVRKKRKRRTKSHFNEELQRSIDLTHED